MEKVSGKVVVITGGSGGIGACAARVLSAKGARIVMAARRTEQLAAIRDDIVTAGGDAVAVECDVSKRADVGALAKVAIDTFGCIDVWVNNAAVSFGGPISDSAIDEWERMVDVNIKGVLYGIGTVLPIMEEQGFGHIINVGSSGGHKVFDPYGVYCGTKHAVRAISEGLQTNAQRSLRVTHIASGEVHAGGTDPDESGLSTMPPQAIAKAIAFAIGQPANIGVNEIVVRSRGAVA
ncbi:MAG: SDR family oxidoreductase [Polyangiales bacterium]